MAIEVKGLAPYFEVFDMATSLQFYRDILGFTVAASDVKSGDPVNWVLLSLNGCQLMLNTRYELHERPPAPDPSLIKGHADATVYFACPNVDAAYEHLRANGVDVKKPIITHYGFKAISVKDPDGFGLCFHHPAN